MRRGPPAPAEKKKSTKVRLNARDITDGNHGDDEWQPGNVAACVSSNVKLRPTRVSKKSTTPTWEGSDEENIKPASIAQSTAKSRAASAATRKRVQDDVKSSKISRPCEATFRTLEFRNKSHSSKHLTPTRRFGDTPRKMGASLLSSGADDSPTANWSPLIGGLMRQESIVAQKASQVGSQETTTANNADGSKVLRHQGDTCWTMWRQSTHPGSHEPSWAARSDRLTNSVHGTRDISPFVATSAGLAARYDRLTNSVHGTRDISPFVTTSAGLGNYPREQNGMQIRTTQEPSSRASLGAPSLSAGVCPVNYAPSLSRSLISAPPLFSRENSAPFPIALAQRVSSSFFLPFMGMADTLSYALELHNENDPSTPTQAL